MSTAVDTTLTLYIISFNPHGNPVKWHLLFPPFRDEETEIQGSELAREGWDSIP